MDAFYASIEQRDHPELRGLPVVVGGRSARGVVAAASYEARQFGIRSAMPGFQARALCPQAVFIPPNMALYASVSAQVHQVFQEFTSEIEPIALDEAFLDITGSVRLFGGAERLARELKTRIAELTQLSATVAVGPNKLVAKIACTLAKPNGLRVVSPAEVAPLLAPLPVRRLWGIGPVLADTLTNIGIKTFAELRSFDSEQLERIVGSRARMLQQLAAGEDDRAVESNRDPKSIGEESTFEQDILDLDAVSAALTAHADEVARRLRRSGHRGRTVTLKIKLGKARGERKARLAGGSGEPSYPLLTRRQTLNEPTDDGARIRSVALELWQRAKISEPVRLLGISVSSLIAREREQLELFTASRPSSRLGAAVDAIRERFGREAIGPAVGRPDKLAPSLTKKRGD
jgi:DNA polymerase-4